MHYPIKRIKYPDSTYIFFADLEEFLPDDFLAYDNPVSIDVSSLHL